MTTRLKPFALAALLCCALCGPTLVHAQIAVYTDRDAFLGAVAAPGVDSFDDLAVESLGTSLDRTAGAYTYTVSAGEGLFGAGGAGDGWLSTDAQFDSIVFSNFSSTVHGLGGEFFGSDVDGQFLAGTTITFNAFDGSATTYLLPDSQIGSFVGFVSTSPLDSVVVGAANDGYWPTANNLVLAAIPEPGTYGMMLAGLGLLGWCTRRRHA